MPIKTTQPRPQFILPDPLDASAISGLYTKSPTQYTKITKFALQRFFEECLRTDGQFYSFFKKIVPDTTGFKVNQELTTNPNDRPLQIARYFTEARERPPQIFIQDNGYSYKPDSLGGLMAGWNLNTTRGPQTVRVMDMVQIPIEVTITTLSESELEDLQAFMSAAVGQFQKFLCGYYLNPAKRSDGVYWRVHLPQQHEMSPKSHAPLHGDPRQQFWQATCTLNTFFENSIFLQYYAKPLASPKTGDLELTVPSTVAIGQQVRVGLLHHNFRIAVYSNDRRVAIVRQISTEWYIEPRRPGTFTLLVTSDQPSASSPEILAQQDITVVARL